MSKNIVNNTRETRIDPYQNFGLVNFLLDLANAANLSVLHCEVAAAASDVKKEVLQHVHPIFRQVHFGVKLRAVHFLLLVGNA